MLTVSTGCCRMNICSVIFSPVTGDRNHIFNNPALAARELGYLNEDVPPAPGRQHAIVEVTLRDLGRDPEGLRRISQESATHVVMGTGWYLEPYYPKEVYEVSAEQHAALMIREIEEGVLAADGTRIRAGVIGEIGTHGGTLSPAEERVLRAAGRASNATGAAVTTHAFMYPTGVDQLSILEEEGVDPRRIAIGHVDTFLDHAYLTGCWTGASICSSTRAGVNTSCLTACVWRCLCGSLTRAGRTPSSSRVTAVT